MLEKMIVDVYFDACFETIVADVCAFPKGRDISGRSEAHGRCITMKVIASLR